MLLYKELWKGAGRVRVVQVKDLMSCHLVFLYVAFYVNVFACNVRDVNTRILKRTSGFLIETNLSTLFWSVLKSSPE